MGNQLNWLHSMKLVLLLVIGFSLSGCLSEGDLGKASTGSDSTGLTDDYLGCVSGTGIDASRIQVNFQYPSGAERVNVYRNGLKVYSSTDSSRTSFTDVGLVEGAEYEYSCEMERSEKTKLGTQIVTASTVSTSAPIFAGIISATALTPTSVRLVWSVPASPGPLAKTYKIYANPGNTVNWSISARSTTNAGVNTMDITGLGDQLPYSFGVRACTASSICDTNTASASLTLSDNGAPTTQGIQSFTAVNGSVILHAPWSDTNGQITKRKVYQKIGGSAPTVIGDMVLTRTEVVLDPTAPLTDITLNGILDNTIYYFVIQDEDSLAQSNNNFSIVTMNSGDMSPPIFTGITSLAVGSPSNSTLVAGFTAIDREGIESSNGASHYVIYASSAVYPSSAASACSSGTILQTLSSTAYPPGATTIQLTGLNERTNYGICIKAKDASGNTSVTTSYLTATTLDATAPDFDGLQTIAFNTNDSSIDLSWNTSSSSDIAKYRVQIWKNTATPTAGQITTIDKTASSNPTGLKITTSTFTYGSNDVVYAIVNACDDADTLPGGAQNCTNWGTTNSKSVTLPDFQPPQGFLGIKDSTHQSSPSEGTATIAWYPPASWTSSYYGFRIYSLNKTTNALAGLLKTCLCATPGACTNADISCNISSLNPGRNYRFHVRAINSAGFETEYLDNNNSYADLTVKDTTAPSFNSGITVGAAPSYTLTWNAATDNMYTGDGAVLSYEVWRKIGSTFNDSTDPSQDGAKRATVSVLTFTETGSFTDGASYYYTICAVDPSGNRKCDGTVAQFTTVDATPPLLSDFESTKINYSPLKKWSLSWTMSDSISPTNMLRVKIYQSETNLPATATTSDTLIFNQLGAVSASDLEGPALVKKYINYLIVVSDQIGNSTSATLSVSSDNRITMTKIKRETGLTTGGQWVLIDGTGFSNNADNGFVSSTEIEINGSPCTSLKVLSSERIACKTPAGSAGTATVKATNPDGSVVSVSGLFSYVATSSELCDNPGSWGTEVAGGTGGSSTPFILCTPSHVMTMGKVIAGGYSKNYLTGGYHYKLGQNIDFTGFTPTSIGGTSASAALNVATFDGDGFGIINYSLTRLDNGSYPRCGFISYMATTAVSTFKNMRFVDSFHDCTLDASTHASHYGMFIGYLTWGASVTLDNIEIYGTFNFKNLDSGASPNVGIVAGWRHGTGVYNIKNSRFNVRFTIPSNSLGGTHFGTFSPAITRLNLTNSKVNLVYNNYKVTNSDRMHVLASNENDSTYPVVINNVEINAIANGAASSSILTFTGDVDWVPGAQHNISKLWGSVVFNKYSMNSGNTGATMFGGPPGTTNTTEVSISELGLRAEVYGQNSNTALRFGLINGQTLHYNNGSSGLFTVNDGYITGSGSFPNLNSSGSFSLHGSAGTTLNLSHFFQAVKFNMTADKQFLHAWGTPTLNFSGVFWDYTVAGASTSEGGDSGALAVGHSTAEMSDQSSGNIYDAAGYDFTPGTGKWQWCPLVTYPMLAIEACP